MNLKDAKETKKIQNVSKNEKTSQKKVSFLQNVQKNSTKNKKMTKKEKEKARKRRWLLFRLFIFEIFFCSVLVVTSWCLNTMEGYYELYNIVHKQSQTIENLVEWLRTNENTPTIKENSGDNKELAYNLTSAEKELLAQLLYHEARGESLECQKAVASVVLNRVESGLWGDTLKDVIYAKNQFEPVGKGLLPNTKPLQKQYEAIDYVIENGATVPSNVLYFRAGHYFEWGTDYINIDNTYFSI